MRLTTALFLTAALMVPGVAAAQMSSDDTKRAWIACDDAVIDVGFPNAGWPESEVRARIFPGSDKLPERILIDAATNTGKVFCILDVDYKVLLYTFDGQKIIDRR